MFVNICVRSCIGGAEKRSKLIGAILLGISGFKPSICTDISNLGRVNADKCLKTGKSALTRLKYSKSLSIKINTHMEYLAGYGLGGFSDSGYLGRVNADFNSGLHAQLINARNDCVNQIKNLKNVVYGQDVFYQSYQVFSSSQCKWPILGVFPNMYKTIKSLRKMRWSKIVKYPLYREGWLFCCRHPLQVLVQLSGSSTGSCTYNIN